jgi:hypothetical protein
MATRYVGGVSGNPDGRPKKKVPIAREAADISKAVIKVCSEPVVVTIGGRRKTMSIGEAILLNYVVKASGRHSRAIRFLHKTFPDMSYMVPEITKIEVQFIPVGALDRPW